jgi:hypothetical protein
MDYTKQFVFLFVFLKFNSINSSYFRGGTITVRPSNILNSSFVLIEFNVFFCWQRSFLASLTYCDELTIKNKTPFGQIGNIICTNQFVNSEYIIVANTSLYCTSFSIIDDWSCGQNRYEYTLSMNKSYSVEYRGGDW